MDHRPWTQSTTPDHPSVDQSLSNIFTLELTVTDAVIDANGHVNNVAYVHWMQDVAIGHFESLGGTAIMEEHGATWVARSHHIEYLRPTFAGDEITIRTWIEDMARATSKRRYEFLKNDAPDTLVARGETTWVFLDVATGRPKRIPKSMVEAVRAR